MRLWRTIGTTVVGVAALLATTAGTGQAATATPPAGPAQSTFPAALLYSSIHPNASPPGANDVACKPAPAHPRPVVLVHGTVENAYDNWAELSPQLKADGYCVFALNFGDTVPGGINPFKGTGDIPASAAQLKSYVDSVLAATGASEVDIVGHSQGGMMPRYYLKNLGGASKVGSLVALAPSNYGTVFNGVLPLVAALPGGEAVTSVACVACVQQRQGSSYLNTLNAGGDTVPGVRYTVITTTYDEVVMPFTNTYLRGSGATNINLQQVCGLDFTGHLGISYDPIAQRLVRNALDPSTARAPTCRYVPPLVS
jgi:triacylglycerol esterase/lipase EstA (alpha/beta hydrolase family)